MRKRDDRVGETRIANCGWKMTIIEYKNKNNITVRFENDKYNEVYEKKCAYREFLLGRVAVPHPSYQKKIYKNAKLYEGMTKTMNCGYNLTIMEYHNSREVTGVWEDGDICEFSIYEFLKGKVTYHNKSSINLKLKQEREGQNIKLKDGQTITVVKYNDSHNILVELEDHSIEKTSWNNLKSGRISKYHINPRTSQIGDVYQTQYGISCKITNVFPPNKYEITFEDGYKKVITSVSYLKKKIILHPIIKRSPHHKFKYFGYTCTFIYSNDTDYYYTCSCSKCGFDEILSVKEMITTPHKCK